MQPISRDPFQSQLLASRRPDVQSGAGIKVPGNTISRPSDGWFEVQYASSFNTVSEGGQSASVEPGTYNVINHTTGERFKNIVVGHDTNNSFSSLEALQSRSSLDMLRDSPSTTDRLGGSTSNGTAGTNGDAAQVTTDDPRPQVPETRYDGHTTIELSTGENWGDTLSNANENGLYTAGGAFVSAVATGSPPPVAVVGTLAGYATGFMATVGADTEIVTEPGSIPNEIVDKSSSFDEDANTTTTTQTYADGTHVQSSINHNDGSTVVKHQDSSGSVTTTVTTNDVDTANSPRTEVTTRPDGTQVTFAISPTGGRYPVSDVNVVEPEPAPIPSSSRPSSNQNSDNDSNSHGGNSSHSSGGLSSGTGNQTSNNPHTA